MNCSGPDSQDLIVSEKQREKSLSWLIIACASPDTSTAQLEQSTDSQAQPEIPDIVKDTVFRQQGTDRKEKVQEEKEEERKGREEEEQYQDRAKEEVPEATTAK